MSADETIGTDEDRAFHNDTFLNDRRRMNKGLVPDYFRNMNVPRCDGKKLRPFTDKIFPNELHYIFSGTLMPNSHIDFLIRSATTCENAILNLSFDWSVSAKIGIDW